MSDALAALNAMGHSAIKCPHCDHPTGSVLIDIVPAMAHGNLMSYPALGHMKFCGHCGQPLTKEAARKTLGTRLSADEAHALAAQIEWEPDRIYGQMEVARMLGIKLAEKLKKDRTAGGIPFEKKGTRINYTGRDLQAWMENGPILQTSKNTAPAQSETDNGHKKLSPKVIPQRPIHSDKYPEPRNVDWESSRRYGNEQIVKLLGPWARYALAEARTAGTLPFEGDNRGYFYLGKDLKKWARSLD